MYRGSSFSTFWQSNTYYLPFLKVVIIISAILVMWSGYFIVVLTCISLMIGGVDHLFMYLLAVVCLWRNVSFKSFANFFRRLSFCCSVVRVLYIYYILDPHQVCDLQICSPVLLIVFWLFDNVPNVQKFNFDEIHFISFHFTAHCFSSHI